MGIRKINKRTRVAKRLLEHLKEKGFGHNSKGLCSLAAEIYHFGKEEDYDLYKTSQVLIIKKLKQFATPQMISANFPFYWPIGDAKTRIQALEQYLDQPFYKR